MPRPDRVLQIHTRYRRRGGEDAVVEAERRLLEGAGIAVDQVVFDNADVQNRGIIGRVGAAASAVWSPAAARRVARAIRSRRPDVVHVHNTFVAASPSVYRAAIRHRVPIVQTLHNYRFACPAGTAFRDGHPCIECVGRVVPWPAVVHASYHGSRAQSAVAAAAMLVPRALGVVEHGIDAYLALTKFQRDLLVRGGLPADRVRVLPNFLEPDPGAGDEARSGFLFVGRLDAEKGVPALLAAATRAPGLVRLAGTGTLVGSVQAASASGTIEYLGSLSQRSVLSELQRSVAMIVPSIWFEGLPLVVLEAFATGTPVIASRIGGLPDLVEEGTTGLLCEPGDAEDLASRIRWAEAHPGEMRQMGDAARSRYVETYRGPAHLAGLLDAYRVVMTARASRG